MLYTKIHRFVWMFSLGITLGFSQNTDKFQKTNAIVFTENKGQVSDQYYKPRTDVLFSGTDGQMIFHLKGKGISYQLYKVESWQEKPHPKDRERKIKVPDKTLIYRIDINWLNANNASVETSNALEGYDNYYSEVCPNGISNVKSFGDVTYKNVYTGIDLHYYSKNGQLKYDYIVSPNSNYKNIKLHIKGAKSVVVNKKGELVITTPLGEIVEPCPLVQQDDKQLKAKWKIMNGIIGFEISGIDPAKEFIIDPAVCIRQWGTYYGSSGGDYGFSTSTDALGNVYLAGNTQANSTAIATSGSHQFIFGGGADCYLAKFNSLGVRQWGTYYGGSGPENLGTCSVDASGNVFLCGQTSSTLGIASASAHQTITVGPGDGFLAKFNSSGVRQWGTYYGGNGLETIYNCCTDQSGNAYLVGASDTYSGTAIASPGCHQPINGGVYPFTDALVAKFDANGVRQWGTLYGGANFETGYFVSADASGNVYICGEAYTSTGTIIATATGHQPIYGGGGNDGFLVKFDANGVRQWGTYYGGSGADDASACNVDLNGDVYLTGGSNTPLAGTIIATPGTHQSTSNGSGEAYLAKFSTNGVRLWSTYYGGAAVDYAYSCVTDATGNIYLGGKTDQSTGTTIATPGSHQTVFAGGGNDAFVAKFDINGVRQWGTYYGGPGYETGYQCAIDAFGNVYLAGETTTTLGANIGSSGSHQPNNGGTSYDGFLVKLQSCNLPSDPVNTTPTSNQTICNNNSTTLTATGSGTLNWFSSLTSTSVIGSGTSFITPQLTTGTYSYYVEALTCGSSTLRTMVSVTVNPDPNIIISVANPTPICPPPTNIGGLNMAGSGAQTYTWMPGSLNTASVSIFPQPSSNITYTLYGTDTNGCIGSVNQFIQVNPLPSLIVSATPSACASDTICLNASGSPIIYSWTGPCAYSSSNSSSCFTVSASCGGTYSVGGTDANGCLNQATVSVNVYPQPTLNVSSTNSLLCLGQTAVLTASGAITYTWNTSVTGSIQIASSSVTTVYTVTGTDQLGCSSNAVFTQSVTDCTNLNELNNNDLKLAIYPNPTSGKLSIFINANNSDLYIELFDIHGKLIKKAPLEKQSQVIDITDVSNGLYFLKFYQNEGLISVFKISKI